MAQQTDDQDYEPREYQDDLDVDSRRHDEVTRELTDDPTETFGVPPQEFRDELKKLDTETDTDDARENIEDVDEDPTGKDR